MRKIRKFDLNRQFTLILCIGAILLNGCSEGDSTSGASSPASSTQDLPADIYYLHLYSTLYDINVPARDYGKSENRKRKENQCIATLAVSPGVRFYADLPNHYEPSIRIDGLMTMRKESFDGAITIDVEGVDVAYSHKQTSSVPPDILVRMGEEPFHFAISGESDPYALDYTID